MTSVDGVTERQTDVLVVGFGGAGTCAAIEAADTGAEVLVVEKMKMPGGSTYISGGVIYAAGTAVQRAAGITDSADAMYKFWMAADGARREEPLVRTLAEHSAPLDVLRGKPICRLYAAGETTGGRMGSFYPASGSNLLDCLVFGRIAGKGVAAEQPLPVVADDLVGASR